MPRPSWDVEAQLPIAAATTHICLQQQVWEDWVCMDAMAGIILLLLKQRFRENLKCFWNFEDHCPVGNHWLVTMGSCCSLTDLVPYRHRSRSCREGTDHSQTSQWGTDFFFVTSTSNRVDLLFRLRCFSSASRASNAILLIVIEDKTQNFPVV